MKVAVMQPYFFPYIGYFQLIEAVDVWVCMDYANFQKKGYMHRNYLPDGETIRVPLIKPSQNRRLYETQVNILDKDMSLFFKQIEHKYSKAPYYNSVLDLFNPVFTKQHEVLSEFNFALVEKIVEYLGIKTRLIVSGSKITEAPRERGIIEICKSLEADHYINAIGGVNLYSHEQFSEHGLELSFLKTQSEGPYHSILADMFLKPREYLIDQLNDFKLVKS